MPFWLAIAGAREHNLRAMSDDQFTKLFTYMQDFRREMDARFAAIEHNIDRIYSLLDAVIKQQEIEEQERLAINNQLSRHEQWIVRAAPVVRIGYKD